MLHVQDRRRHRRVSMVCAVVLRDRAGKVVFRGRSADVSPAGMKIIGPPPATASEGMEVWLEIKVTSARSSGPHSRVVKLRGYVRRVTDIGDWKSVIVIFESNFSPRLLQQDL